MGNQRSAVVNSTARYNTTATDSPSTATHNATATDLSVWSHGLISRRTSWGSRIVPYTENKGEEHGRGERGVGNADVYEVNILETSGNEAYPRPVAYEFTTPGLYHFCT